MSFVVIKKTATIITLFCLLCSLFTVKINSQTTINGESFETKKIALTFDDGPHPKITKSVLEILKKYDIKATFFVIGKNVDLYPNQLLEIYSSGHEIGNHTESHKNLTTLTEKEIKKELESCHNKVSNLIGYEMKIMRPPGGKIDIKTQKIVSKMGYESVLWTIDTHDWSHETTKNIFNNVSNSIQDRDIILFHDYISGKYSTVEALNILIPALEKQGYQFVTVSELLKEKVSK